MTTTTKTKASRDEILAAYKKVQATLPAGASLTRDKFRKESGIAESDYEYHFGTYAELKRAAGDAPTRADAKLKTAIAKVVSVSARSSVAKEREEYGEKYLRADKGRYKTMLVASDLHDKEVDPFVMRVMIDTAARVQPDNIVLGGDVFDLPEFGRYTIDPREWDAVGRIKYAHENIFAPLRDAAPDAQFDLIEGNHECVSTDTELLTVTGWIKAGDYYALKARPPIASFDLTTQKITYNKPVAVAQQTGREIFEIQSTFKKERITGNHSIIYDGARTELQSLKRIDGRRCLNAIYDAPAIPLALDKNLVRLAMWVMSYGSIMRTEHADGCYILFNKINRRIERRIKGVVQRIKGIKWEKIKDGLEIQGASLAAVLEVITGMDDIPHGLRWHEVPDWLDQLPEEYGHVVAQELAWAATVGTGCLRTSYYNGYNHATAEKLQWFLVRRNVPCALKLLPMGQYILTFNETEKMELRRGRTVTRDVYAKSGTVVSVQTVDGTLITRLDGKINFTGNCRLVKHLADFSPATRAILGDLHGMTIGDLFGLRKFEINYVAKADLKAYSAKEHDRELENNYRVYHDNVLVHHFPHARHMGLPGVNGHHHSHQVWPMFNIHQGAYEWHQLGAGHKRSASYCEGERWHNGFALIHIDTLTKSVNIEYIPVTNMAIVGGKWYTRESHELL